MTGICARADPAGTCSLLALGDALQFRPTQGLIPRATQEIRLLK